MPDDTILIFLNIAQVSHMSQVCRLYSNYFIRFKIDILLPTYVEFSDNSTQFN